MASSWANGDYCRSSLPCLITSQQSRTNDSTGKSDVVYNKCRAESEIRKSEGEVADRWSNITVKTVK